MVVIMNSALKKGLPFLLAVLSSVKPSVVEEYRSDLQNLYLSSSFSALEIEKLLENENFDYLELSKKCAKDLTFYRTGIQNRELWAMKMLDASSKGQTGILEGNVINLGNYDECVTTNYADIQGRYCTYTLSVADNSVPSVLKPTLSFCLPASCDIKDLELLAESTIVRNLTFQKFGIFPGFATCSSIEPVKWLWTGIISVSLLAILILFVIFCTILDTLCSPQMKEKGFFNAANKFSMYTNGRKILSTKESPNALPSLPGLRSLSMVWIFLGHQHAIEMLAPSFNSAELVDCIKSWKLMYINLAPFAVDTFFTISGFLMSYLFMKEMAKGTKFNIFHYYIHRYIRLTPSLLIVLISVLYTYPSLGSGPGWNFIMSYTSDTCYQNWWAILLYAQNIFSKGNTCLIHTWYLAVDMQLFWMSPIILYPLAQKPKIGLALLGLFFIISIVVPILVFISGDYIVPVYDPGMSYEKFINQFAEFYSVTYARAAPWIVGIYVGYRMAAKKPRKLNKIESAFFWSLAIMAFGFCIYGHYVINQTVHHRHMIFEIIYVGLSRPLWGAGIAWIIYASTNGYGGIINTILSMPIFIPMSKISYSFYLTHLAVQIIRLATYRTPVYFSPTNIMSVSLFNIIISLVIAILFSLFIESPVLALEKMMLRKNHEKKSESSKQLCIDNSKKKQTTEKIKKQI